MIIHDQFLTHQGTGHLSGVLQYFVRLAGCSQPCPIRRVCDEQSALPPVGEQVDVEAFASDIDRQFRHRCDWLHITGGEPLEQLPSLSVFSHSMQRLGWKRHLQTSGLLSVGDCGFDFLTVSPKAKAERLVQRFGDELVVVNEPKWIDEETLAEFSSLDFDWFFILPVDSDGRFNFLETEALAKRLGSKWRIATQSHKYWGSK